MQLAGTLRDTGHALLDLGCSAGDGGRARRQAGGSRSHLAEAVGQLARPVVELRGTLGHLLRSRSPADSALEAADLFDLAIWLKPSYTFFR